MSIAHLPGVNVLSCPVRFLILKILYKHCLLSITCRAPRPDPPPPPSPRRLELQNPINIIFLISKPTDTVKCDEIPERTACQPHDVSSQVHFILIKANVPCFDPHECVLMRGAHGPACGSQEEEPSAGPEMARDPVASLAALRVCVFLGNFQGRSIPSHLRAPFPLHPAPLPLVLCSLKPGK